MEKWYNKQYILWLISEIFTNGKCNSKPENPTFSFFLFSLREFFSVSFYTPTPMVTGPQKQSEFIERSQGECSSGTFVRHMIS